MAAIAAQLVPVSRNAVAIAAGGLATVVIHIEHIGGLPAVLHEDLQVTFAVIRAGAEHAASLHAAKADDVVEDGFQILAPYNLALLQAVGQTLNGRGLDLGAVVVDGDIAIASRCYGNVNGAAGRFLRRQVGRGSRIAMGAAIAGDFGSGLVQVADGNRLAHVFGCDAVQLLLLYFQARFLLDGEGLQDKACPGGGGSRIGNGVFNGGAGLGLLGLFTGCRGVLGDGRGRAGTGKTKQTQRGQQGKRFLFLH